MTEPPRVLHVVESWRPVVSGYTSRSWTIVERQRRLNISRPSVLVTSRQPVYGHTQAAALPGVRVEVVPTSRRERVGRRLSPFFVDRATLALAIARAASAVDLVHVHWSSGIGRAAADGASLADKPLVAEVRFDLAGAVSTESLRRRLPWIEAMLRKRFEAHLPGAAAVVAASHSLAALLEKSLGIGPGKLTVVPNGVDVRPTADGGALRAGLGIGQETVVVGTTSNMLRYENLEALLAAVAAIPGTHALMVGDGPVRGELEARARRLGLRASFTGRVPPETIPEHLAAIDIFAIPRADATITAFASPIKAVEAMIAGRAIVATALGDLPALLADGRGVLVLAGDERAFVGAVRRMAESPDLRSGLGAAAQDFATRNLNWDQSISRYTEVYAKAMSD